MTNAAPNGAASESERPAPPASDSSELAVSDASRRLYRVLRGLLYWVMRLWFRVEVVGASHVPTSGGFILAPGAHRSILDTPAVSASTTRMLRYMGAEKYFRPPGLGRFLRAVGGFPVERSLTDREALALSQAILEAGEPLVVFPEATRFEGPLVQPLKEGTVFLAARAGVPIVPVGIGGAERSLPKGASVPRPRKLVLVVGSPIPAPINAEGGRVKRSAIRAATERLQDQLQAVFDEAQQRAGV